MYQGSKERKKRPVLDIPLSSLEKFLEALAFIGILLNIIFIAMFWTELPSKIPTHFGPSGAPDGWGGKGMLLFLTGMNIMMYLLLTIVNKFPHTFNYPVKITPENALKQYYLARHLLGFLKTETVLLFTYILWGTIQVALGKAEGLGILFLPIILFIIFGTIGVYFYKAIRNT
ncbi:MAG: DUF1648 domain-containing protein [Clostridia bacterium]|nr:DUF1648 domain-containing protein [Clostridia bacterium]